MIKPRTVSGIRNPHLCGDAHFSDLNMEKNARDSSASLIRSCILEANICNFSEGECVIWCDMLKKMRGKSGWLAMGTEKVNRERTTDRIV